MLNIAVQTYVPWNLHEPSPGLYNWERIADLTGYLDVAASLGLNVLLRAGPYICGEWDFGGLPWWLGYPAVRSFEIGCQAQQLLLAKCCLRLQACASELCAPAGAWRSEAALAQHKQQVPGLC